MEKKMLKRVVAHPKLYLRVSGKVEHVPKGTELTLTPAQCLALGGKLSDPANVSKLDATVAGGKVVDGEQGGTEALTRLAAELDDAKAETVKTTEALTALAAELDTARKEIKALKTPAKK